jgi:ubiquinone/menaquinone biosynthesis C-methylase UbiE
MERQQPQWRGLRAKSAAWWFNSQARIRAERGTLETIKSKVNKDDTVLDLGAGTGYFTLAVAPMLETGKVIALDLSPEMLGSLIRSARKKRLTGRIEMVVGDATRTGLPDSSVDLIMSGNLLHELPNPEAAVQEMARVLRPGGRVVIHDFHDGIVGRLMKLMHHHDARGPLGVGEIGGMLEDAGFVEVAVTASGMRYLAAGRKDGARAA